MILNQRGVLYLNGIHKNKLRDVLSLFLQTPREEEPLLPVRICCICQCIGWKTGLEGRKWNRLVGKGRRACQAEDMEEEREVTDT